MQIEKRRLPIYIVLNCLTLGIYGFIVSSKIGKEVDAICAGDGEEPHYSYAGAVLFRSIPTFLGLIVGLIVGLVSTSVSSLIDGIFGGIGDLVGNIIPFADIDDIFYYAGDIFDGIMGYSAFAQEASAIRGIAIISTMIGFAIVFTLIGSIFSGIYHEYWWYKQAARLKLNANRYGITVKESGTDIFVLRMFFKAAFSAVSFVLYVCSFLLPGLLVLLITLGKKPSAVLAALIIALFFLIPLLVFGSELSVGACFSAYFMFKNLNRYADASLNGGAGFDPMAYEYYPAISNKYPNFVPNAIGRIGVIPGNGDWKKPEDEVSSAPVSTPAIAMATGSLIGLKGTCAGYTFDLAPGEEVVIGKDAKVSSVVIETAYKEVSRKHVSITYNVMGDSYNVVDYSSNGTYANETKLTPNTPSTWPRGTVIKLANGKNSFRLG